MRHRYGMRTAARSSVAACVVTVGLCLLGWKLGWLPRNSGRAVEFLAHGHDAEAGTSSPPAAAASQRAAQTASFPEAGSPDVDVSLATELRRALAAHHKTPRVARPHAPVSAAPNTPVQRDNDSMGDSATAHASTSANFAESADTATPTPPQARVGNAAGTKLRVAGTTTSSVSTTRGPTRKQEGVIPASLATSAEAAPPLVPMADRKTPVPPGNGEPALQTPLQPAPQQPLILDPGRQRQQAADDLRPPTGTTTAPQRTARIPDRSATSPELPREQSEPPHAASASAPVEFAEIDRRIERGDDLGALRELSKIYWQQPHRRTQIQDKLDSVARRVFFSPQPHYVPPYVVRRGDVLERIARQYSVTWQYLARLNRIDPKRIRPGQKLKVIRGPFAAFVDLSDFELTVHLKGYYVKRYPVGIGKDGASPVGRFVVRKKVENPQYTTPEGKVIPADDPTNPVGEYWIDIGDGYGIHGTIDPQSVGRAESRGCIRLRNDDIAELFTLLVVGSEVVIRP